MQLSTKPRITNSERAVVIEHWLRTTFNDAQYPIDIIPIMVQYGEESEDFLDLAENPKVQKMLTKLGDNYPEVEKVILSRNITKINKRGKEQQRILLLTDKALYNVKHKYLNKCQRRIDLDKIASITTSTTSNVFSVHIPEEYDYRYKIENKERVIDVFAQLYAHMNTNNAKLPINKSSEDNILSHPQSRSSCDVQTREQRLRRYRELIGKDRYPDEIYDRENITITSQLIQTEDTVHPNDFEYIKVIASGSMGKVVQVRKKDNGEIYAMKVLKKKALIAKHQVEHTSASRNMLKTIRMNQHPFMMQLRWSFQTERNIYLVMEYDHTCELLFELKKKRRFSEQQTKFIAAEVALALGYLHSMDYIYRELKPENILMNRDGHICLMDTEVIIRNIELDSDDMCSVPEYLAPEIVMNLGSGKAVDWWSFGILLYELTVGIPPFYSRNINEIYRKIQTAPLLFPPNLSDLCKDLIRKLLERDPKQRLGSNTNDVRDIQNHAFFGDIDWNKLYNKDIQPLYKPRTQIDDTSGFDALFLKESIVDMHTFVPSTFNNDGFDGFIYTSHNFGFEGFSLKSDTIGLSLGGAKDVNNFRECITKNRMPSVDSIAYNGLLSEYYFDTKTTKHRVEEKKVQDIDENSKLFYPTYCYAKTSKLWMNVHADNDDHKNEYEYYVSVGLNSNIKQQDFKRKHLNLVLLIDKSGSMTTRLTSNCMSSYSKMDSAKDATLSLIQQLTSKDRLGIVVFDGTAHVLNELQFINDININKLRYDINNISANHSTNFNAGYNTVMQMYTTLYTDEEHKLNRINDEYDNRVIILTDAQPNGSYNSSNLLKMVESQAENKSMRIYTTFIGIGLDFNSSLIESISETRGCNYYSVKSKAEFLKQMNEEFDLMVTPLVFNVCLTMTCEGNSCQIDKVYGSQQAVADKIIKNGEIVRIHSLFPSKKSTAKGGTKGGLQLIKLKMKENNNGNVNVQLEVTFEDRNCKSYKNSQNITLKTCTKMEQFIKTDMIEEEKRNYFDNKGIRKAIVLCKYVDLMKQWIRRESMNSNQLRVSDEFKTKFTDFLQYFKQEMVQCDDNTLNQEIDIMNILTNANQ